MANVQDVLDAQRNIEASLASRMDVFEESLKQAATGVSHSNVDELTQDFKNFRDMAWSILKALRAQIQALTLQVDDIDSYNRRNALLFSGIPENDGEDCTAVTLGVINSTMNLTEINSSTFQLCHRLGTRKTTGCRPILVRFTNIKTRNMIWNEKKRLKSSPTVISEFLTKSRQAVFSATRLYFGIRNCWTRDGSVFIKLPNNDRKRVASTEELEKLMRKYPAITASGATSQPLAGASVPGAATRAVTRNKTAAATATAAAATASGSASRKAKK